MRSASDIEVEGGMQAKIAGPKTDRQKPRRPMSQAACAAASGEKRRRASERVLRSGITDILAGYVGKAKRTGTICLSIPKSPGAKPKANPTSCGKWMIGI
jgi:hypothetical protein